MTPFSPRRPAPGIHAGDDLQANAAPVRIDGVRTHALENCRTRLVTTAVLFMAAFFVIGLRMIDVSVLDPATDRPAIASSARVDQADIQRADIVDRNGVILATSLPTVSLYANASEVPDPAGAARQLATILPDIDIADTRRRLSSGRPFVYLRRNLTPRQQYDVNALGIPGLSFEKDERRVYPHGALAAHVVGMTDIDNRGVSGLEREFDTALRTAHTPLRVSLDVRMQMIVRSELANAVADYQAAGAAGIVMDVRTGEVLALASLPDFDPDDPPPATDARMFNRATKGVYELGSVMKLFDIAAALDLGTTTMTTSYDARGVLKLSGFTIHDDDPENRWLTVAEILKYSSNIGAARIALQMGTANQQAFLGKVGLLAPLPMELPELGTPQVPNPWREINTATIAFGHGIAITPLHLISGVSALVNGGLYRAPTLIAEDGDAAARTGQRVVKETTSEDMRSLMRLVVTEGTGGKADVPGYLVGGKTGTAEKATKGGYKRKSVVASFIGAFPMDNPRYAVLVSLDEPQGNKETHGFITAGWNAAPTAGRIIAQIAPLTGLLPARTPPQLPESIARASASHPDGAPPDDRQLANIQ